MKNKEKHHTVKIIPKSNKCRVKIDAHKDKKT
jgi:hypothetical protein